MNQIQTIKSKLENLIKEWHLGRSAEAKYRCEAYKELLEYINSLQEEHMNEDLEDYAKKESESFAEREYEIDYIDRNALAKGYYWGVKAGAQWQALHSLETIKGMEEQAFLAGVEAEQNNKSFSVMKLEDFLLLIQDEEVRIELEIDDEEEDYQYHHFWLSDFRSNLDIAKYYRHYDVSSFSFEPEKEKNSQIRIYIKQKL